MANRVVIGSQWGDEGKAKVVDFLTLDADIIVRFQGGANAGHTVEVGDKKFVFHLIPSGIMHPDKICVIGNGVVLDPIQTLNEIADLHTKGINPEGRLFIANNAHVVLPYHSTLDNEAMAKVHNEEFKVMYDVPEIDPEVVIKDYLELGQKIKPFVADVSEMLYKALKENKRLVFEGAQGTILDVDQGTYPFVTSSNTVAGYASCGAGIGPTAINQVVGVVKAYTTRVGNGPFPTELLDETGDTLRKIGNEYGATTGRNRRCGWFDAPVVRKAAMVNGLTHLAITKLDVLDTFDTIKICTHYECDGEKIENFPNQLSKVGRCVPVYEEMPGWKCDTTKCRKLEELPANARKYLDRMAELVGVKIGMISIGAKRDQSIVVDLD